jgi:hypothetical protein
MTNNTFIFVACISIAFLQTPNAICAVSPSQVLVLYNADWKKDEPLTDLGQDSKEIADHYVYMHTDPKTGEKPYMLGLSCTHAAKHLKDSHLNADHLLEQSADNASGVVLTHQKNPLKTGQDLRDSRALEFIFPKNEKAAWRIETLKIRLVQDRKDAVLLVENGQSQQGGRVQVQQEGPWNVRTNARGFLKGSFTAVATCKDVSGKEYEWKAEYGDFIEVAFSRTGPDGERDDAVYLQDIEAQVKTFLENKDHARPDGTLLKDHILFIVICYGLPRTTVATYGIARGITELINNYGAIISLEQRLQVMYYNLEAVSGVTPQPLRFQNFPPFTAFYFRAPQARPLYGLAANPFLHPMVYNKEKGDFDKLPDPVSFSVESRKRFPNQHLFFVMRIDAPSPMQARSLIDRAVYASRYDLSDLGRVGSVVKSDEEKKAGAIERYPIAKWLQKKGYHHLYYGGAGRNRLEFLRVAAGQGFLNRAPVYLPGGIGATVISHNSWGKGELVKDLAMGVTATAGAGRSYRGAPHIHDKSWWDDEILYPFFMRGRTLGEALLMNQAHLEWITTFVGDPLYCLAQAKGKDEVAPLIDRNRDVHFFIQKGIAGNSEVWMQIELKNTPEAPETSQVKVIFDGRDEIISQTFEAMPYAKIGKPKDSCGHIIRLEITDPCFNRFTMDVVVKCDNGHQIKNAFLKNFIAHEPILEVISTP